MPAQELLRREQEGVGEQPEASEAAESASSPDVANTAHTQNSGTRETVLFEKPHY